MEKVRDADFESFRDLLYIFEGNIFLGSLNHADISSVNACSSGKFFL